LTSIWDPSETIEGLGLYTSCTPY